MLASTFWEQKPFHADKELLHEEAVISPIKRTSLPEGANDQEIEMEIESFYESIASGARRILEGTEAEA